MPEDHPVTVRGFTRADRDQVTHLVNRHVNAVVPNVSVSVQQVLGQVEREPGEVVVDPWVTERVTLVAEQAERVLAAAHLHRYADEERVAAHLRGSAQIRWLLCEPPQSPYWPDEGHAAGPALLAACLVRFARWGARSWGADLGLPAPASSGVPEQWPHIRDLLQRAGFRGGRDETIHLARTAELPRPAVLPDVRRSLGAAGTRFTARRDGADIGHIEIDTTLEAGQRSGLSDGLADVGNLWVRPDVRRQGIGTGLLGCAARWLELGGVSRLLAYTVDDETDEIAFLAASGFRELTRTTRGLTMTPGAPAGG